MGCMSEQVFAAKVLQGYENMLGQHSLVSKSQIVLGRAI